jgi:hypothetical protein
MCAHAPAETLYRMHGPANSPLNRVDGRAYCAPMFASE